MSSRDCVVAVNAAPPFAVRSTAGAPLGVDPAKLVRQAWCVVRLVRLQEIVSTTIEELNLLDVRELLGRELSDLERQFPENPVAKALEACTVELCDECGMPGAVEARAAHGESIRQLVEQQPETWVNTFREALGRYRSSAGSRLEASLDPLRA